MHPSRRDVLKAGAAAGAALFFRGLPAIGSAGNSGRASSLFPGFTLAESDLHNHTLLSDGSGRAEEAFAMMRAAGLDVAALTDHATTQRQGGVASCPSTCGAVVGIHEESWRTAGTLADAADAPGSFVAMRGFEWTTLAMGHINVWFTETWTDGLTMGGFGSVRDAEYAAYEAEGQTPLPVADLVETLRPLLYTTPSPATVDRFYEWLASPVNRPLLGGGGPDAIAGFNHPNLFGNFQDFKFDARVVDRLVSLEMFSFDKGDYLYEGLDQGRISPLTQCLDAGWRVGLIGVSDNHGSTFGRSAGRGGLWVPDLSRAGVRDALVNRRFFAAKEPGILLDAAANGVPMGRSVAHRSGPVTIDVDIDIVGATDRPLLLQVLATGSPLPTIVASMPIEVGPRRITRFTLDHDVADGRWLVVRITDPAQPADPRATGAFAAAGRGMAYASPFFLDPDA